MKLNPDCIRAILLAVEDVVDPDTPFIYERGKTIHKSLSKFEHKEILYHFQQCKMSGLIVNLKTYDEGSYIFVGDLSPDGHKFLANVRQDNIWNSTKEIAAKVGSKSLDTLIQISSSVITDLIKAQLGLT